MSEIIYKSAIEQTEALLSHYGFDLGEQTAQELISQWLDDYHALWIRLAVLEALFQGRYKAISVKQILNFWVKKGNPTFHFNHEFEQLICHRIPRHLLSFIQAKTGVEGDYHSLNSAQVHRDRSTGNKQQSLSEPKNVPQRHQMPLEVGKVPPPAIQQKRFPPTAPAHRKEKSPKIASTPHKYPEPQPGKDTGEILELQAISNITGNLAPLKTKISTAEKSGQDNRQKQQLSAFTSISPINQFTPNPDNSSFYLKLKAVANQKIKSEEELNMMS